MDFLRSNCFIFEALKFWALYIPDLKFRDEKAFSLNGFVQGFEEGCSRLEYFLLKYYSPLIWKKLKSAFEICVLVEFYLFWMSSVDLSLAKPATQNKILLCFGRCEFPQSNRNLISASQLFNTLPQELTYPEKALGIADWFPNNSLYHVRKEARFLVWSYFILPWDSNGFLWQISQ